MHVVRALAAFVAVRESARVCECASRLCCTLLHRTPHRQTRAFPCWKNAKRHITHSPDRTHVRSTLSIRYNKGKRAFADEELHAATRERARFSMGSCVRRSRSHTRSHAAWPLALHAARTFACMRHSRSHIRSHAAQPLAHSLAHEVLAGLDLQL